MAWFKRQRKDSSGKGTKAEDVWTICPSCKAHIFKDEWRKANRVCPKCEYHDRLTCRERIEILVDKGSFHELHTEVTTSDPLSFVDAKGPYSEKAKAAKKKTGETESVLTGRGKLSGRRVVLAVMDFRFLGGSLGSGTGERILRAATFALKHKMPLIIFSASGGARMHEGIVSLMQMAKTCAGIARLDDAGIPYISVMTHPTTGGVSASFAMVGDINIAEPGALIGFAGRRVIEETIKQKLPKDFQTAEYLQDHGFLDAIVNRNDMRDYLISVLRYWNK
ncbi:MAG: acetyl-CoA carboxylase carboxyltransferase subunit beta [Kiritimatiellae bacterium]|nr:acetyl-CoA carboxylase carboxyltransferase subunit beta [Kiritimatiellia bacterium]